MRYADNKEEYRAIGIDIPDVTLRNNGIGTKALKLFIDYLLGYGYKHLYIQTWSGNYRMISVAKKLGFVEKYREKNDFELNGISYDSITYFM